MFQILQFEMESSVSSRLALAIQKRDVNLVMNTEDEPLFWDEMGRLGILHEFFDAKKNLSLEALVKGSKPDSSTAPVKKAG